MFTLRSRVRVGRNGHGSKYHRLGLSVRRLEERNAPAVLTRSYYPEPNGPQQSAAFGNVVVATDNYHLVAVGNASVLGLQRSGQVFVYGTDNVLVTTLYSPLPTTDQQFGRSLASNGQYVAVGGLKAPVYLFKLDSATPNLPIATISNPTPQPNDFFGESLAVAGQRLVIGAWGQSPGISEAGIAYVYDLNSISTNTTPIITLNNPDPEPSDRFGISVALSGSRVVVGAQQDNTGAVEAGAAYVFDLNSSTPTTPIVTIRNPEPQPIDRFGNKVAISDDIVVVGARYNSAGASGAGSAYVYNLASPTTNVPIVTLNNPSPGQGDYFGNSIAVDQEYVVVGTPNDDSGKPYSGSAYVYDLNSPSPSVPVTSLSNPLPSQNDWFGASVSIAGNRVFVSAVNADNGASDSGKVYTYDTNSKTPTVPVATLANLTAPAGVRFGTSTAVSGKYVVVGAPFDISDGINGGLVYVYDVSSKNGNVPIMTLKNPTPYAMDRFGAAISISGNYVVVGAFGDEAPSDDSGSAYVYNLSSNTPTVPTITLKNPTPIANDNFGVSVSVSGNIVVVGAPNDDAGALNAGSAYVYNLTAATPATPILTLNNPTPVAEDQFGNSVAIDGNRIVVGAWQDDTGLNNAGSAYVYDMTSKTPSVPMVTITDPMPHQNDDFGRTVAISGNKVVVRTAGYTLGTNGIVYLFDMTSPTPTIPIQSFVHLVAYDLSLNTLAISQDYLVIGDYLGSVGANRDGRAFVYNLNSPTPTTPMVTLNNPSPSNYESFGASVAISGSHVFVGTSQDNSQNFQQGGVYEYALSPARADQVHVNDGATQRSRVDRLDVAFDQPINFVNTPDQAFQLKRQSDGLSVGLNATVAGNNTVVLTFAGGPIEFGSLADGRYTLTIFANQISNSNGPLDGNGDGIAGDNYVLVGTPANGLFRLFGDANGDGQVSASDFNAFRMSYGVSSLAFDFNNDGVVTAADFNQFRLRYGVMLVP